MEEIMRRGNVAVTALAALITGSNALAREPVSFHTRALTGVSGDDPRGPGLGLGISFAAPMVFTPAKGLNTSGQVPLGLQLAGPGITSDNNVLWFISGPNGN